MGATIIIEKEVTLYDRNRKVVSSALNVDVTGEPTRVMYEVCSVSNAYWLAKWMMNKGFQFEGGWQSLDEEMLRDMLDAFKQVVDGASPELVFSINDYEYRCEQVVSSALNSIKASYDSLERAVAELEDDYVQDVVINLWY